MTDLTNLRARAERMIDALADEDNHDLVPWICETGPAVLRDLLAALPPACACDGGLFGAGPGDHAIGCPARPPEDPGERRPVAGWDVDECDKGGASMDAGPLRLEVFWTFGRGGGWTFEVQAGVYLAAIMARPPIGDAMFGDRIAAQLAAEDAADALLCAGRRALGRVK